MSRNICVIFLHIKSLILKKMYRTEIFDTKRLVMDDSQNFIQNIHKENVTPNTMDKTSTQDTGVLERPTTDGATGEWKPRVLVIGPGGIKGLKTLGFLSPLEDAGVLDSIDTFCGVSVGAIISLLIVAGYQIREIVGEATCLDIFSEMDGFNLKRVLDNNGLLSNEPIRKKLTGLIINKFGIVPTLHGLYMQTGKALITVSLNATDDECTYMTPFSHPTMSCVDAVMFSMNVPFVFYQIIHRGKTFVDGALANPYPVDFFDDGNTNILGIYMKSVDGREKITHYNSLISQIERPNDKNLTFATYAYKVIHALMEHRRIDILARSSDRCRHVCLQTKVFDILGYSVTLEEKATMLVEGFNEGVEFLDKDYEEPNIRSQKKYNYPPYYD